MGAMGFSPGYKMRLRGLYVPLPRRKTVCRVLTEAMDNCTRALIIIAFLTSAVVPNTPAAEATSQLPSEQQVLTFVGNTIDWNRQFPTSQRIGSEPADLLFLENNRPTAIRPTLELIRHDHAVLALCNQTGGLDVYALHCSPRGSWTY